MTSNYLGIKTVTAILFALSLTFAVSGCAPQMIWKKPGASQAQFEQAKANCMLGAKEKVPEATALVTTSYSDYRDTRCDSDGCTTVASGSPAGLATIDRNEELRIQVYRACLYEKGWSEQPAE